MPRKGEYKDITGMKFNHLTAVRLIRIEPKSSIWEFECDCGKKIIRRASNITTKNSRTKSCGHLNEKGSPKENLVGQKFNRLTVIKYIGSSERRKNRWLCKCDCGKLVKVETSHLKDGSTKSCGCFNQERIGDFNRKTGQTNTRLHYVYLNMLNRCYRKNSYSYKYYGGRGIHVCPEWQGEHGFENFYKWALESGYDKEAKRGECTLDRINVDGNYDPDNCRWVDLHTQANNKRTNRHIKINGEIGTVANMARKYNLNYGVLLRYANGYPNIKHANLKIEVVSHE